MDITGLTALLKPLLAMVINLFQIALTVVAIWKGCELGTKIIKEADNPEARSKSIGAIKYIFIGIFIGVISSSVINVVMEIFWTTYNPGVKILNSSIRNNLKAFLYPWKK